MFEPKEKNTQGVKVLKVKHFPDPSRFPEGSVVDSPRAPHKTGKEKTRGAAVLPLPYFILPMQKELNL